MRSHNHCFLFILLLSLVFPINLKADGVKGRVVDDETGMPIADANIQLVVKIYNGQTTSVSSTDSLGLFCLSSYFTGRAVISISFLGYKTETVSEYLFSDNESSDTIDLGDIKLKMVPELLKEVVVKGKAKRFVMKGDTVVFNPEAFNLDDGDRIATLLKQLPGVSIKEGKIYFNEKEVHLKINGRNVADDELTVLLPAEAVDKIKAYEKKSELAEVTGMNDGQEQQVLDITIKDSFMDKWYGRTRLSAYASDNYLASANIHYLSDTDPIGIYARASDCGSKTQGVWGEYES